MNIMSPRESSKGTSCGGGGRGGSRACSLAPLAPNPPFPSPPELDFPPINRLSHLATPLVGDTDTLSLDGDVCLAPFPRASPCRPPDTLTPCRPPAPRTALAGDSKTPEREGKGANGPDLSASPRGAGGGEGGAAWKGLSRGEREARVPVTGAGPRKIPSPDEWGRLHRVEG